MNPRFPCLLGHFFGLYENFSHRYFCIHASYGQPQSQLRSRPCVHGDVLKVNKREKGKHRDPAPTPTHNQCTVSAELFPKKCFTKLSGKAPSVLSKSLHAFSLYSS